MDEPRITASVYLKVLGLSVTVRRTRCMGCRRAIVAGEYRMAFSSVKTMGKLKPFQQPILRFVCLSCVKIDLTEVIQTARKLRKQVIRKLQVDKVFYATRSLGLEFEAQAAAIVKWRVDKITARRYATKRKAEKNRLKYTAEVAAVKPALTAVQILSAADFEENGPCN